METYLEQYNQQRPQPINKNTFELLLMLFPVLKVIKADGDVDRFEKAFYTEQLQKQKALDQHLDEALVKEEIEYILANLDTLNTLFLEALQAFNQLNGVSDHLLDLMLGASRVSYDSWKNNLIYVEPVSWFKMPQKLIAMFLSPDENKKRISEAEKNTMLTVLKAVEGLTERNINILQTL
ncbi:MAG: hypothetical protein ACFB0B_20355 [Thermonemataceae bacterium]